VSHCAEISQRGYVGPLPCNPHAPRSGRTVTATVSRVSQFQYFNVMQLSASFHCSTYITLLRFIVLQYYMLRRQLCVAFSGFYHFHQF